MKHFPTIPALSAALCLFAALPAAADSRTLAFDVLREGSPIGTHVVSIRTSGPRTEVSIEIDLEVRFAFLTVYRYTHRSRETWTGDRLVKHSRRRPTTTARAPRSRRAPPPEGIAVDGSAGRYVAPVDTYPTSYWRRDKVRRTQLLDTQSGKLVSVRNTGLGARDMPVDGAAQPVEVYRVDGELAAEVGYAADGSWATLAFEARGCTHRLHPPHADGRLIQIKAGLAARVHAARRCPHAPCPAIRWPAIRAGRPAPCRKFAVRHLRGADVLSAYPLARLAAGHLTIADWLRFAEAMGAEPPGARRTRRAASGPVPSMACWRSKTQRGYLQAFCSFAVRPDLAAGRRLDIDNIVTLDLIDSEGPAGELIGSIEKLARELDCPAFAIRLPPGRSAAGAGRHALEALLGSAHDQSGVYRLVGTPEIAPDFRRSRPLVSCPDIARSA